MGRCRNLGSWKLFLWYAPQLSGASIQCFVILCSLWGHYWGLLQFVAGKDWGQEEEGQQRMKWLYGIISSMGMRETLAYCSPWGRNESDMTERLNSNNILQGFLFVCLFPSCVPKGLTSSLTQREVAAIIDDSDILCLLVWEAVFYFSTVKVLIMRKMFCNCVG